MDSKSNKELEECVLRILVHGDPNKLTESKVRKLAADETGFDLTDPANREIVKRTVANYFVNSQPEAEPNQRKTAQTAKVSKPPAKQPPQNPGRRRNLILIDDEDEEAEPETNNTRSNGNPEESEPQDASLESDEEGERKLTSKKAKRRRADDTDDKEVEGVNGKKHTEQRFSESKNFPNGDHPACQLSKGRFVVIQSYSGKKLVSIREYYEKDGQQLPGRKGISLTLEQWQALKKGIPDIEAALKEFKG